MVEIIYSPAAQAILRQNAARRSSGVTKDGKLQCSCGPGGCTCKPTRVTRDTASMSAMLDDPTVPGSARIGRPISHAALITTVMALRHLSGRLDALEGHGASDVDQRHAEAMQKQADMHKELQIAKVEKMAAAHEANKYEVSEIHEASEPAAERSDGSLFKPPPRDKSEPFGGFFDPSVGSQSQKTPQHPMGGNSMTRKTTRDEIAVGMNIASPAMTKTRVDTSLTEPFETDKGADPAQQRMAAAYAARGATLTPGDRGQTVESKNIREPLPGMTWAAMSGVGNERGATNFGAPQKWVPDQPETERKDTTEVEPEEAEQNRREIRTGDVNRRWRENEYQKLGFVRKQISETINARWK